MNLFSLIIKFFKYLLIAKRNNWNYQILFSCDIYIPNLPPSTNISHPVGIVITDLAKIGSNCTILQNVTIAKKGDKGPVIGNNVYLGAGSIIMGDIEIGNNSIIGAGAIVTKTLPPNSIYYNKIAPIISKNENRA